MANPSKMKIQHYVLIPNRMDFKTKAIIGVKEGQYNSKLPSPNKCSQNR